MDSTSFSNISKGKLKGKMKVSSPKIKNTLKKSKFIPTPPQPRLSSSFYTT